MAFSYWRTGTYPANQGAQGIQRNNGYCCYGDYKSTGWGRAGWNKWAWSSSCLRTDSITFNMWSPTALGASLKGWYQGDHVGGNNGDPVSSWLDDSGNGNNGTNSGNNPDLSAGALNGLNVLQFTAANSDAFDLPSGMVSGFTEGSAFFVAKVTGETVNSGPPVGGFGTSGVGEQYPYVDGHAYVGFLSTTRPDLGDPGAISTWHIGSFQSKTSDYRAAFNGVDYYTNTSNVVGAQTGAVHLGVNGNYFDGQIAEVIICNSFLTTTDRQNVEGYLAWKWGLVANLDAGHPYKSAPPPPPSGPTIYNVSILASATPSPAVLRATAKPMSTASTLAPALVRSTGKITRTASTLSPRLSRANGKILLTAVTPSPSLTRSSARSLLTASTLAPSLTRQAGKPLRTTSTPAPALTLARIFARSLLTASNPVPSLRRDTAKSLLTATTPAPAMVRAMTKSLRTTTTPAPLLSRQFIKSLRVASVPVPRLTATRVFLKSIQAVTGGVASGGTAGVRVTAAFFRG